MSRKLRISVFDGLCSEHYVDDRRYVRMLFLESHCVNKVRGALECKLWPGLELGFSKTLRQYWLTSMATIPESDFMEAIRKMLNPC